MKLIHEQDLKLRITEDLIRELHRLCRAGLGDAESVWYLDRAKVMAALENGHQIAELREFLQARDDQPLPETVEGFLREAERNAGRLRDRGPAVLVECADAALAETLAQHEKTKPLCLRAGKRHLAVYAADEEKFRQALHDLGYCLPKV